MVPDSEQNAGRKGIKPTTPLGLALISFGVFGALVETCYPSRTRHHEFLFEAGCFGLAGLIVLVRVIWGRIHR